MTDKLWCPMCESHCTTKSSLSFSEADIRGKATACFDADKGIVYFHEDYK